MRHVGIGALERHLVDAARIERREDLLVLSPLFSQRVLPVEIFLNPVAVADVHGRRALEALDGPVQRVDAPLTHVVEEDVERGLVELDHVDPRRDEFTCFVVQDLRKCHGHVCSPAVVRIGDRVADRHRARQRELEPAVRRCSRELHFVEVHGSRSAYGTGYGGDLDCIAVVADAHRRLQIPIDTGNRFEESMHEMDAVLLAVGHDVDAGVALDIEPLADSPLFALDQCLALELPGCPELLGLC